LRFIPRLSAVAAVLAALVVSPLSPVASAAGESRAGAPSTDAAGSAARGCDPIDPAACLLPFPNDWYTEPDRRTPTGLRLAFDSAVLPISAAGVATRPDAWDRLDGFSPGSSLIARVPGIDLARSGVAPVTDIGRSLRRDAPIVILDAVTGERWPYFAELDATATDPSRQALLVRPARNFADGHRYVVALRSLRDSSGAVLAAPEAFAKAAGRTLPRHDPLAARQQALRPVLDRLARAGVPTRDLYLAWDFTVASTQSLTGDLLSIRDDAFARLGKAAPDFTVTEVRDYTPEQDARIAREVFGTFKVPSYLDRPGGPTGSRFNRGPDGRPAQLPGNVQTARFQCEIPRVAFTTPSRPSVYGHGLLGGADEVDAGNIKAMAQERDFTFCATDWIGMAADDVGTVVGSLVDINTFEAVPNRLQQGVLNALFLGRLMVHRSGFTGDAAFRTPAGRPLVDVRHGLSYDGNSQGGIMGGTFMAVSQDARRGVLGVTGMNYSVLLNRSSDFPPFGAWLGLGYPDKLDQQLVFALLQLQWDHAETNGYANHLGERRPLPRTPSHDVLMHVAYGDHQVANETADAEARTIGARLRVPALDPGRSPDVVPYWGIRRAPALFGGSTMVVWDSGTPTPPGTNLPPSEPEYGDDPHSDPRSTVTARLQKSVFLRTGLVVDVCGGDPCHSDAYSAQP
jgi:hypothetical protein